MQYVEAPAVYDGDATSLFLAGGITGCPDWQQDLVAALSATRLALLNPRRAQFLPTGVAALEQITWEHCALRKATAIAFWFPCETLCPIVLYELGAWSMTTKPLFVGVHPDYRRIQDVRIQTALVRPDVQVVTDLSGLARQIVAWAGES